MFFWSIFAILIIAFYKWVKTSHSYFEKRGIPYSKPVFLVGSNLNLFYNRKSIDCAIMEWYNDMKQEKISGMFQFLTPFFIVRDPKLVKQIAVKDFEHFADRRQFLDESVDKLFGKALFFLAGEKWRDMRATLSPMFTGSKMRQMYKLVAEVGRQSAETLRKKIEAGDENVFEFKDLAMKFSVDVIGTTAFGIEINSFEDPDNDFQLVAREATKIFSFSNLSSFVKILGYLLVPKLMQKLKISIFSKTTEAFFHDSVKSMMKTREEQGIVRNDIIDLLMQAKKGSLKHENEESSTTSEGFSTVEESHVGKIHVKRVWDDDDLVAQCFLFFFAGFETISATMSFMAYELTANPDIQQRLYEEIKSIEDSLDGLPLSYEQIQGMKFMDQVVSETLRKWPSMPAFDRLCLKDYPIESGDKKFVIEKGMMVQIMTYAFHHDPEYFPNPEKFDPERFSEENRGSINKDAYLPFGLGPRNCIGSRFALMELKTIFYYLLLNFSFEITEKTQIPLKLYPVPTSMKTEKGVWVELRPRF